MAITKRAKLFSISIKDKAERQEIVIVSFSI